MLWHKNKIYYSDRTFEFSITRERDVTKTMKSCSYQPLLELIYRSSSWWLHHVEKCVWVRLRSVVIAPYAVVGCVYALLYLPQMCSMKTHAMNRRDITRTGTGPT